MTPKILLPFLLILISFSANAQKYGNTWYFGDKAGMHFNKCILKAVTTGEINGFEGSSAFQEGICMFISICSTSKINPISTRMLSEHCYGFNVIDIPELQEPPEMN
ncbi:MAG: hypothetical protein IPL22_18715 [Bacteroidetes bacterium]|nr:hypothetical protein [Bacteroidota bacterium]